jgi:chromatin segregation and condensation protein Rec8/ScpA/Scc1 (kleisin family)
MQAKMHGVMTFLASLELTRRRDVSLRQVRHFGELWLYRGEGDGDDPGEAKTEGAAESDAPRRPEGGAE